MHQDPHHLPLGDHMPDMRATHFGREQIALAQRLYGVCRLPYGGPDPLGLGLGWCCFGGTIVHNEHRDQYGRVWTTPEYTVRQTPVTMTPSDDAHRGHVHKGQRR